MAGISEMALTTLSTISTQATGIATTSATPVSPPFLLQAFSYAPTTLITEVSTTISHSQHPAPTVSHCNLRTVFEGLVTCDDKENTNADLQDREAWIASNSPLTWTLIIFNLMNAVALVLAYYTGRIDNRGNPDQSRIDEEILSTIRAERRRALRRAVGDEQRRRAIARAQALYDSINHPTGYSPRSSMSDDGNDDPADRPQPPPPAPATQANTSLRRRIARPYERVSLWLFNLKWAISEYCARKTFVERHEMVRVHCEANLAAGCGYVSSLPPVRAQVYEMQPMDRSRVG